MAAATRSAAMKIDWAKISTSLGLKGQTAAALQAFKKRNDDARRKLNQLSAQATTIDFASYRDTLENRAIVDQIESQFKQFKPQTYDVSRQIKAIEAFEVQAIKSAEATKGKVDAELKDLKQALTNIETTRPWEDMTTDDILAANPDVEKATEKMVANHQWMPAGYKEKFGDLSVL